jgi:hypothetical protein
MLHSPFRTIVNTFVATHDGDPGCWVIGTFGELERSPGVSLYD